ncbi:MAG: anhydro-N-acetylmuramic acid kinase [Micavibrio sp.]
MPENKVYTAIGLMSGTSLDGVDCAAIETDGCGYVKPLGFLTIPYTDEERAAIRACFGGRERHAPSIRDAERLLTLKHAQAVEQLRIKGDIVGFHGQTIYHAPKDGVTIQIGDGALLARETGMDVVDDFRSADVRAGGEGAPLAPLYHAARVRHGGFELPVTLLNIGGVANVTWIGEGENDIVAFDTGPGNALMDDWVKSRTGAAYDEDGKLAAAGKPVRALLEQWYAHEYFSRKPPKSLDRDQWDIAALGPLTKGMDVISTEDGAATLLRFTGDMIVRAQEHMPQTPKSWYACGGGRHNKALMKYLNEELNGAVKSVDDLGWDGDATEAECFAYLAVRSLLGLPLSLPGTTGLPEPVTGGVFHSCKKD